MVTSGLTLEIAAGKSVAIVGASGCGKTTLVKLMLRLLTREFAGFMYATLSENWSTYFSMSKHQMRSVSATLYGEVERAYGSQRQGIRMSVH
nr:ATP-binding cassette domain-containing protein [Shewanella salipaludis]